MGDLVSFCVSNHNYGRFLSPLIEALLHQTHDNVEIVVVDDGSTDDSREILSQYEDRIIVELQEQAGQAAACNRAFSLSSGDIVVFHDSDDLLHRDAAARLVEAFARRDVAMVLSRLEDVDVDGKPTGGMRPQVGCPLWGGELRQLVLSRCAFFWPETTGQAFRRTFLEDALPIPFMLNPDMHLSHLGAIAAPVIALQDPIGCYRVHGSNKRIAPPVRGPAWLDLKIEERELLYDEIRSFAQRRGVFDDVNAASSWSPHDYIMATLRIARCRLGGHPGRWRHMFAGVRGVVGHPQLRVTGQARHAAWFVGTTILPMPLARRFIAQRFPQAS